MAAKQPIIPQNRPADRGCVILSLLSVTPSKRQKHGWNEQGSVLMCVHYKRMNEWERDANAASARKLFLSLEMRWGQIGYLPNIIIVLALTSSLVSWTGFRPVSALLIAGIDWTWWLTLTLTVPWTEDETCMSVSVASPWVAANRHYFIYSANL